MIEQRKTREEWDVEYQIKPVPKDQKMTREEYLKLKAKENSKLSKLAKGIGQFAERVSRNQRAGMVVGFEEDQEGESRISRIGKRAVETRS